MTADYNGESKELIIDGSYRDENSDRCRNEASHHVHSRIGVWKYRFTPEDKIEFLDSAQQAAAKYCINCGNALTIADYPQSRKCNTCLKWED